MKAVLSVLALCLAGGLAYSQEIKRTNGDEELKAQILKKVEERLQKQHEALILEVKKMLDEHFAKAAKAAETKPETAKKQPGFLGIQGKEVAEGIEIVQVLKDTAAMKAGLRKGDIVMSVNGKKVAKIQDLITALGEFGAGTKTRVEFKRDGQVSKTTATLGVRKDGDDDDDDGDDDDDD